MRRETDSRPADPMNASRDEMSVNDTKHSLRNELVSNRQRNRARRAEKEIRNVLPVFFIRELVPVHPASLNPEL